MSTCVVCEQVFDRGRTTDIKISCRLCQELFHHGCANLTAADLKSINNSINVCWFCNKCVVKIDTYKTIDTKIDAVLEIVKKNSEKLEKHDNLLNKLDKNNGFRANLNSTPATPTQKRRYADVAAIGANSNDGSDGYVTVTNKRQRRQASKQTERKASEGNVLVVKKLNKDDKTDMHSKVKSILDPVKDPVKHLHLTGQGKTVIHCNTREDMATIQQRIQHEIGEGVTVAEPATVKPRVVISGVDPDFITAASDVIMLDHDNTTDGAAEEGLASSSIIDYVKFIDMLKKQNHELFTFTSVLTGVDYRLRKDKTYDVILSADTVTFDKLVEVNRVKVGWELCYVREHINVLRCYKCSAYNHTSTSCKERESFCPKCSLNHSISDCGATDEERKCINCIRSNHLFNTALRVDHAAWSATCPIYIRQLQKKKDRVRYAD